MNKFENVLGGGDWGFLYSEAPCPGELGLGGSCMVRSITSWVMVTWNPPMDRMTDKQTLLKVLPSCNFVGGDKDVRFAFGAE